MHGKSIDNKLYPYHVVLTTKPKDQGLRRSVKEKLSYTVRRNVLTCVLQCDQKHSPFSPTLTVSCNFEKNSLPVSVVLIVTSTWSQIPCFGKFVLGVTQMICITFQRGLGGGAGRGGSWKKGAV